MSGIEFHQSGAGHWLRVGSLPIHASVDRHRPPHRTRDGARRAPLPRNRSTTFRRGPDQRGGVRRRRAPPVLGRAVAERPRAGRRGRPAGRSGGCASSSSAAAWACPSIAALAAGARPLATDWYADALRYAEANARGTTGRELETLLVDWQRPPAELLALAPFDLVVGADVLYEARNGAALAALVPRLVPPGGELLITDPRRPDAVHLLEPLAAAGWSARVRGHHLFGPPRRVRIGGAAASVARTAQAGWPGVRSHRGKAVARLASRSSVAQLVEHPAVNRRVAGSSPARGVSKSPGYPGLFCNRRRSVSGRVVPVWYHLSVGAVHRASSGAPPARARPVRVPERSAQ